MSATSSYALRKPNPSLRPVNPVAGAPRVKLHVVPTFTKRRITLPMWTTIVVLMLASLIVPAVFNAQMAVTSYAMHSQELELSRLKDYQADLITRAREAQSPQKLAEKAQELGLVPAGSTGYINLASQSVTPGEAAH